MVAKAPKVRFFGKRIFVLHRLKALMETPAGRREVYEV